MVFFTAFSLDSLDILQQLSFGDGRLYWTFMIDFIVNKRPIYSFGLVYTSFDTRSSLEQLCPSSWSIWLL